MWHTLCVCIVLYGCVYVCVCAHICRMCLPPQLVLLRVSDNASLPWLPYKEAMLHYMHCVCVIFCSPCLMAYREVWTITQLDLITRWTLQPSNVTHLKFILTHTWKSSLTNLTSGMHTQEAVMTPRMQYLTPSYTCLHLSHFPDSQVLCTLFSLLSWSRLFSLLHY